jgi:hypothetical protein
VAFGRAGKGKAKMASAKHKKVKVKDGKAGPLLASLIAALSLAGATLATFEARAGDVEPGAFSESAPESAPESRLRLELPAAQRRGNAIENGEQIDELVTNNLMRAMSGSTSRWSIASAFLYSGGRVSAPFAEDRPNIADATGTIPKSLLTGQVSAKLNLDVQNAVMAGVGIRWIAPLTAGGPTHYDEPSVDADNPYLQYQRIYKWSGVQSVLQLQYTKFTNANLVAEGYDGQLNLYQENMYQIPGSRLSIGGSAWMQGQWFRRSGPFGAPGTDSYMEDVGDDQSDYSFALVPEFEYQISESLNARAELWLWNFEHVRSASGPNTYHADRAFQSIGLGISLARDIFLFPNLQFSLANLSAQETTVGLNANINVF